MTDATGYRLANVADARRIIEVRDTAKREHDEALLAAARAIDAEDELALDTERMRLLLAMGRLEWADAQLHSIAVFAMEGA